MKSVIRPFIIFTLLWLLLATSSNGAENYKPVVVPFTTNPDRLVIVPATFGAAMAGHVFFDTGAGLDVLAPSIVKKLGGKPMGQFTGFRMNGERLDLPLYTISELAIGPLLKKNAVVGTWDALDAPSFKGIEGVISLSDFRNTAFTLDFSNNTLVFETQQSLAKRRAAGTSVPLKFDDQRGMALDSFAEFLVGTRSGECVIDTGSPSATVSMRYMQGLGIDSKGEKVHRRESRNLAGVMVAYYDTVVPQVALEAAPSIRTGHPQVSFSDIVYDCVIGVDFWVGKTVTYDIPKRELIISGHSQ